MTRISRWLVFLPVAVLAFFSAPIQAETVYGLNAVYYQIGETPPTKSDDAYPSCGSEIEDNLNRSFDGEPFTPCPNDLFMVHYTGFITLPAHDTIQFWLAADDGGTLKIGTEEWGDWSDKGCSAIDSPVMTLPSETALPLDGWFYENGGGTCFMLAWSINGGDFEIVPANAFTVAPQRIATTTEFKATIPIATTTSTASTTTVQIETTTSISATTTEAPTTTQIPLPATTTTNTVLPTTTEVVTTTTVLPVTTTLISPDTTTTSVPEVAIPNLAETPIEEAQEYFESLDIGALSADEVTELIAEVQNAPVEVREAFEEAINIFGGEADNYVPLGSTVPIKTRRVIVVATAFMIAMPSPSIKRN
jgi:hypothetical protein